MSQSGISAFLSSEEALADWNLLTNFGTHEPNEQELTKWYYTWVDRWHGIQKEVVVKYLLKDYQERSKKLKELGREKYDAWMEEVANLRKQEAYAKMKEDIERGKRDREAEKKVVGKVNFTEDDSLNKTETDIITDKIKTMTIDK